MKRRDELLRELANMDRSEAESAKRKQQQANYRKWKERPEVIVLGRAYYEMPGMGDYRRSDGKLTLSMSVPGNCGYTYEVSDGAVPYSLVMYFHNVLDNGMRAELQRGLNDLARRVIEKAFQSPRFVIEMMGLTSSYYLQEYPPSKHAEMKREVREEQFKLLDKFKPEELCDLRLSHGNGILAAYVKSRKLRIFEEEKV